MISAQFREPSALPHRNRHQTKYVMLLSDAVARFALSLAVSVSASTRDFYLHGLRNFEAFCNQQLDIKCVKDVDDTLLFRWYLDMQERGYKLRTLNGYTKGVKRFFSWLVDEELLERNPTKGLKIKEPKDRVKRSLSERDYQRLLDAARLKSPRSYLFVLLLADTGARIAEIANTETRHIELDHDSQRGHILVTGKGDKQRYIHLGHKTYLALNAFLMFTHKGDKWLFAGRNGPIKTNTLRMALYKLADSAGCTGPVNPHAFRHRFARVYLVRGGDIESLSKQLGHSSTAITIKHYIQWDSSDLDRIHEQVDPSRVDIDDKLS